MTNKTQKQKTYSMTTAKRVKQVPPGFKGCVIARCIGEDFGESGKGNPQISLKWEILLPETYESDYDHNFYDMTSLELRQYLGLNEVDGEGNDTKNVEYLTSTLCPLLGIDSSKFNAANPLKSESNVDGISFLGKQVQMFLTAQERIEKRRNGTTGKWENCKDFRGQDIKRGWEFAMIDRSAILGLYDGADAQSAAANRPA